MAELTLDILKKLNYNFQVDEKSSTTEILVIRTKFQNAADVDDFVDSLQRGTDTNFVVRSTRPNLQRLLFHKKWVCQHSSYHKVSTSKKDAGCKSFIDIYIKKITKDTQKKDCFLMLSEPLPCIIKINLEHSHSTESADAQKRLKVMSETKKEFEEYFEKGLSVNEARKEHEKKLIANYGHTILANSAYNPTQRQARYLHMKWRDLKYGTIDETFSKLKEKLKSYENEGCIVRYTDDEIWSVVVITPVMSRMQQQPASSEIIFVDSTSGCESTDSTFTVFISASKAGGIPIAILLHPSQTTESYVNAFSLLKETSQFCFGGKEMPAIFMTDNSPAEKNALKTVWPSSKQLLCHFHVAQAEWRWLMSNTSDVCQEERQTVMKLFQAVMYAKDDDSVKRTYCKILELEDKHPKFVDRFLKFFERKEEWVALYRMNMITRNHNTNNICEAAIRIIKEIVLSRTRAYNIVALIDFIVDIFNKYLVRRLLEKAYSRGNNFNSLYEDLISKMQNVKVEKLSKLEKDNIYLVPSNTQPNLRYIVNIDIGYCTCINGKMGAFCKHQCFLMHHLQINLPNSLFLSAVDKYNLAEVALGALCPRVEFFESFSSENDINNKENVKPLTDINCQILNLSMPDFDEKRSLSNTVLYDVQGTNKYASEEVKESFVEQMRRLMTFNVNEKNLTKLVKKFERVSDDYTLNQILLKMNRVLRTNRKRKICVNPNSRNRRRVGASKRSTAISPGRCSKAKIICKNKKQKRKHSLKLNIESNVLNSKK